MAPGPVAKVLHDYPAGFHRRGRPISILVIDVGSSAVRASVVRPDGSLEAARQLAISPEHPMPGLVELDGAALARAALEVARALPG